MAYRDFTLTQVKQQFDLNIATGVFLRDIPKLFPRERLTNLLDRSVPFAGGLGNEKVRSELIVAPLLFEFRELLDRQIGLFSGTDFSVDVELGLSGDCDFLLTRSKSELIIEDPAVIVIQAEKGDFNASWGHCAAQMVAAQKFDCQRQIFNQRAKGQELPIYGSVTTGTFWQFLKLTGEDLTIDVTEYSLKPIDRILGILKWAIDSH
jgi:hypothetical protein